MSTPSHLENLRKEFAAILKLYNDINIQQTATDTKINGIKDTYNDLVKKNPVKTLLFCLDSLFFQYKILNLEIEHYNRKLALLQNRMYGDYYKLYHLMVSQIKDLGIVLGSGDGGATEFPIYKDIDPFYKYKIEDITAIHDRILLILGELYKICDTKTAIIKQHCDSIAVGESILIFINAMVYERNTLLGHIQLFSKYLEFYHQSQARYLDGVYRAILDFDANLEDSVLINAEKPLEISEDDIRVNLEDIYGGADGVADCGADLGANENPLCKEDSGAFESEGEDLDGPYLNIQRLGADTSSSGTIAYIDPGEPPSTEEDYIPQNNTPENITMEINENASETPPTPQIDNENIPII